MVSRISLVASRTLTWHDVDKFTFIWDSDLVIVHVDAVHGKETILSNHTPEVLEELHMWLRTTTVDKVNPFYLEDEK